MKLVLLILLLLLASIIVNSQVEPIKELYFNGFDSAFSSFWLDGGAVIEDNGMLQLTTSKRGRTTGHGVYSSPFHFNNTKVSSFSTAFAFAIVPEYPRLGGHGLAFTITPSKVLPLALPSQYLGLLSPTDFGNFSNHLFAVEFDTVKDFEFGDINANHVGIDLNSLVSNASVPAAHFPDGSTKKQPPVPVDLKGGMVIQAWVDYDSSTNQLDVRLSLTSSKPTSPILSCHLDLSSILQDTMYVGFSASTGLLASSHYILGWSFKMNGQARSLDLKTLPSLPVLKSTKKGVNLRVIVSTTVLAMIVVTGLALYLVRRMKMKYAHDIEAWELEIGPHRFPYQELKQATRGFNDKHLIGSGGFGRVYKGILPNCNTQVAVKRISQDSKQGFQEFMSEIETIGKLRHRNLVQLLGWGRRHSDLLLVYEFMPNGSLDKHLFNHPEAFLNWEQRLKIIKGVALGLVYLHEEWEQAVIHRDIKAANVLLDEEMSGRVGDFGLAKLYKHGGNPSTTRIVGTLGYLAPELMRLCKPTTSSDVFAFGALLLEVVCGRRPIEGSAVAGEVLLVEWVRHRWRVGSVLEVVDPKLGGEFDSQQCLMVLKLGLMCSNDSPGARPSMRQVVMYLEGEVALPELVLVALESDELEYEQLMHSTCSTSSHVGRVSTQANANYDVVSGGQLGR